jgi:cytochrome c biogenesis protein CcmG, thiol:disulfide interchange protein DsbE
MKSWRGPRLIAICIGILTLALVGVLATRDTAGERDSLSPLVGQVAPEFTGEDILSGDRRQLSSELGKWTFVNFFASWCTGCIVEHPDLVELSQANTDLQLISVISGDNVKDAKAFFAKRGGNWPVIDAERATVDYGVTGLPESFLITPNGEIAYWFKGPITKARVEARFAEAKAAFSAPAPAPAPAAAQASASTSQP